MFPTDYTQTSPKAFEVKVKMAFHKAPDFFIAGAMKCGTTTLHVFLSTHPQIFIPKGEVKYFAIDDPIQQPEITFNEPSGFGRYKYNSSELNSWYSQKFEAAEDGVLTGEDSPAYLASPQAAARIRDCRPDAKFIFCFRDPVKRLLSQYWHQMLRGRVLYSLADELRAHPNELLNRSYYRDQLQYYLDQFPPEQFFFILFEEFVDNPSRILHDLSHFLGVEVVDFPSLEIPKVNQTTYHRFPKLRRFHNWLNRNRTSNQDQRSLPGYAIHRQSFLTRLWRHLHYRINPTQPNCPESISEELVEFLAEHFRERNSGLEEMTGLNLKDHWLGW